MRAAVQADECADCVNLSALRGHWLDNAPFGAPLPLSWRMIFTENRNSTFRDHALPEASLFSEQASWWCARLGRRNASRERICAFASFHLSPVGRGRERQRAGEGAWPRF